MSKLIDSNKTSHQGKHWSAEEDAQLTDLIIKQKKPITEVATIHKRSAGGIRSRLKILKIDAQSNKEHTELKEKHIDVQNINQNEKQNVQESKTVEMCSDDEGDDEVFGTTNGISVKYSFGTFIGFNKDSKTDNPTPDNETKQKLNDNDLEDDTDQNEEMKKILKMPKIGSVKKIMKSDNKVVKVVGKKKLAKDLDDPDMLVVKPKNNLFKRQVLAAK